jgi:hypothetical protein
LTSKISAARSADIKNVKAELEKILTPDNGKPNFHYPFPQHRSEFGFNNLDTGLMMAPQKLYHQMKESDEDAEG